MPGAFSSDESDHDVVTAFDVAPPVDVAAVSAGDLASDFAAPAPQTGPRDPQAAAALYQHLAEPARQATDPPNLSDDPNLFTVPPIPKLKLPTGVTLQGGQVDSPYPFQPRQPFLPAPGGDGPQPRKWWEGDGPQLQLSPEFMPKPPNAQLPPGWVPDMSDHPTLQQPATITDPDTHTLRPNPNYRPPRDPPAPPPAPPRRIEMPDVSQVQITRVDEQK
jgi:hypothetical protein